jgi:tetratricopeptide (TPR) repeat protein
VGFLSNLPIKVDGAVVSSINEQLEQAEAAYNDGRYPESLQLYDQILADTADRADDPAVKPIRLKTFPQAGRLHQMMGNARKTLKIYQQYYIEAGGSHDAVQALCNIGDTYNQIGERLKGLEALREALQLADALNDTAGRAQAHGSIGIIYQHLGRIEDAINQIEKALAIFEQIDDVQGQIRSLVRMGFAHFYQGEVDKTIAVLEKALALARANATHDRIPLLLNNLGECYQVLYDLDRALALHREGLEMAEQLGLRHLQTDLSRNLGVDLLRSGRIDEGMERLYYALSLSQETHNLEIEMQCLYALALSEIERGNAPQARQYSERLQWLAEKNQARGYQADAYHALGLCSKAEGDAITAQQLWQQAIFLGHETHRRPLLWRVHAEMAKVMPNEDLAQVHYRIAAEVIQQIAYPIEDEPLKAVFLCAPPIAAILTAAL